MDMESAIIKLMVCPDCGLEYDSRASDCPNCVEPAEPLPPPDPNSPLVLVWQGRHPIAFAFAKSILDEARIPYLQSAGYSGRSNAMQMARAGSNAMWIKVLEPQAETARELLEGIDDETVEAEIVE
jgi:hypothetical protein